MRRKREEEKESDAKLAQGHAAAEGGVRQSVETPARTYAERLQARCEYPNTSEYRQSCFKWEL